jgi:DMSO/TMAO reductase YedYZ molybdopterin-dependent catalytic subunit
VFEDRHGKSASYPLPDVLSGKVFLAYQVNGTTLPRKHGFPLRVVADGYYGAEWVKYVDRVRVEKT